MIQKLWGYLHSLKHIVKLLQTWLIETKDTAGNRGVMICLGQCGLRCLSASFIFRCNHLCWPVKCGYDANEDNALKLQDYFLQFYTELLYIPCIKHLFM